MDSYQFYKSLYDRELNRRKDLDGAINLPITILSILVAANSYLISQNKTIELNSILIISKVLFFLILLSFGTSVYFLILSYNNLFRGFGYRNLGLTTKIRAYETIGIPEYNSLVDENEKINFENVIIEKLTVYTDDHITFNDKRSYYLFRAKGFIMITLALTGLKFILISSKYFINE